jgi:hypothetical protein
VRNVLLIVVTAVVALAGAGQAHALTATEIRIGDHPAFVRVVVDFSDGRLLSPNLMALDPLPYADGQSTLEVRKPGIDTDAAARQAFGVRARLVQRTNRILLRLTFVRHRFKYLAYEIFRSPERLVVDLWKSRPPVPAAVFTSAPQGGCLTLGSWLVGAHGTCTRSGIFGNRALPEGSRGVRSQRHLLPRGLRSRTLVPVALSGGPETVDFSEGRPLPTPRSA